MMRRVLVPMISLALISPAVIAKGYSNSDTSKAAPVAMSKSGNHQNNHRNAVDLILEDHKYIRSTIERLDDNLDSNVTEARSVFKELKDFLVKHENMEQKIWYPELEKNDKNGNLKKIIADLKKQEQDASSAIKEIDKIKDDKAWADKVKSFTKDVENHAKDEEKNLFPKVKDSLDEAKLDEIGEKLKQYKDKNHMKS